MRHEASKKALLQRFGLPLFQRVDHRASSSATSNRFPGDPYLAHSFDLVSVRNVAFPIASAMDFPRPVTSATQGDYALATGPTSAYCASPHYTLPSQRKCDRLPLAPPPVAARRRWERPDRAMALADSWPLAECRQTGGLATAAFAGTFPGRNLMNLKQTVAGILMAASFVAAGLLMSSIGHAQDAKVKTAMELLRSMADK